MDILVKNMDNFFIHLSPLPRRFPTPAPVQSIGYVPAKRDHITRTFQTLNFSLILAGTGTYEWQGKLHPLQAPCVITQWPGIAMNYGPRTGTTWEELFLIYPPDTLPFFEARNLLSCEHPIWSINRPADVREHVTTLLEGLRSQARDGLADRVDRACEGLLLETHLGTRQYAQTSRAADAVDAIRKHVREHCFQQHDFDQLARKHGLSVATFRRYWKQYVQVPPARYVTSLRIRAACRMLVETDLSIHEIAQETGFNDEFYFSRCFRSVMNMPPRTYRQQHIPARPWPATTPPRSKRSTLPPQKA
jgi:AraC-like DNA-binding protein